MENHTKRIRKTRRQGLATGKDIDRRGTRAVLRGTGMAGRDIPGEPRANARRDSLSTGRKARRQARSIAAKPKRTANAR